MSRNSIMMEFPIGYPIKDGCLYDPVTAAIIVTATAATYSAYETHETRKDQERATKRAEGQAKAAQDEQAALAAKEEKAAAASLKYKQARLLKGSRGRSGLLFGSELGTEDTTNTKQTLGG